MNQATSSLAERKEFWRAVQDERCYEPKGAGTGSYTGRVLIDWNRAANTSAEGRPRASGTLSWAGQCCRGSLDLPSLGELSTEGQLSAGLMTRGLARVTPSWASPGDFNIGLILKVKALVTVLKHIHVFSSLAVLSNVLRNMRFLKEFPPWR